MPSLIEVARSRDYPMFIVFAHFVWTVHCGGRTRKPVKPPKMLDPTRRILQSSGRPSIVKAVATTSTSPDAVPSTAEPKSGSVAPTLEKAMGEQDSTDTNHARRTNSLFWSAVGTSCLLAILIGSNIGGGGSDAAGNGMEAGYAFLGGLMALGAIGLLSVIFALTRVIWVRYLLVALVVAFSFVLLLAVLFSL